MEQQQQIQPEQVSEFKEEVLEEEAEEEQQIKPRGVDIESDSGNHRKHQNH